MITQDQLNIKQKKRSNLFKWTGQFSPELVEILLQTYAKETDLILDPFMGSGTVLAEAGSLKCQAFGIEINPAACKIAQLYTLINLPNLHRLSLVKEFEKKLNNILVSNLPLFNLNNNIHLDSFSYLIDLLNNQLLSPSEKLLLESLITLIDKKHNKIPNNEIILTQWVKIKKNILKLPYSPQPIQLAHCDSRTLPISSNLVDLIVTSPPYINVFNYHQQYRYSMEALGYNILKIAQSEIGSNRKYRANRFLTVIQYILDLTQVFIELNRVIKKTGLVIFVVGRESNIKKTSFYNFRIIAEIAKLSGFKLNQQQERFFQNRFGQIIYEDLLYFQLDQKIISSLTKESLALAQDFLIDAKQRVPPESLLDLNDALDKLITVKPSPILNYE